MPHYWEIGDSCYASAIADTGIEEDDLIGKLDTLSNVDEKCTKLLRKCAAVTRQEIGDQQSGSRAIFHEILLTEHQYVSDLHFVVRHYMLPLVAAANAALDVPLPFRNSSHRKEFYHGIFGNLLDLIMVNMRLLRDLQLAYSNSSGAVGDLFLRWLGRDEGRAMRVYTAYCSNYQGRALPMLDQFSASCGEESEFSMALQEFLMANERRPEARKLPLKSFLMRPITRLARYPLLLDALVKYSLDVGPLSKAIGQLKLTLNQVNEETGRIQNSQRLQDIQRKLSLGRRNNNNNNNSPLSPIIPSSPFIEGSKFDYSAIAEPQLLLSEPDMQEIALDNPKRRLIRESRMQIRLWGDGNHQQAATISGLAVLLDTALWLIRENDQSLGSYSLLLPPIPLHILSVVSPSRDYDTPVSNDNHVMRRSLPLSLSPTDRADADSPVADESDLPERGRSATPPIPARTTSRTTSRPPPPPPPLSIINTDNNLVIKHDRPPTPDSPTRFTLLRRGRSEEDFRRRRQQLYSFITPIDHQNSLNSHGKEDGDDASIQCFCPGRSGGMTFTLIPATPADCKQWHHLLAVMTDRARNSRQRFQSLSVFHPSPPSVAFLRNGGPIRCCAEFKDNGMLLFANGNGLFATNTFGAGGDGSAATDSDTQPPDNTVQPSGWHFRLLNITGIQQIQVVAKWQMLLVLANGRISAFPLAKLGLPNLWKFSRQLASNGDLLSSSSLLSPTTTIATTATTTTTSNTTTSNSGSSSAGNPPAVLSNISRFSIGNLAEDTLILAVVADDGRCVRLFEHSSGALSRSNSAPSSIVAANRPNHSRHNSTSAATVGSRQSFKAAASNLLRKLSHMGNRSTEQRNSSGDNMNTTFTTTIDTDDEASFLSGSKDVENKNDATEMRSFRVIEELFSTSTINRVHFMGGSGRLCLAADRGFELVDIKQTLTGDRRVIRTPIVTIFSPTMTGAALAMLPIEFTSDSSKVLWLCCFAESGVLVEPTTGQSTGQLIRWTGRPQSFHYRSPYLFAFDPRGSLVEIRDLSDQGRLVQVVNASAGSDQTHSSILDCSTNEIDGGGEVYFSTTTITAASSVSPPQQKSLMSSSKKRLRKDQKNSLRVDLLKFQQLAAQNPPIL